MKAIFNMVLAAAGVLFILFSSHFLKNRSLAPMDSDAASNIVFQQDISYGTLPKQKLDLCKPKNLQGKVPGVIIIHGGGSDKSKHTAQCKKLAENGFVAVAVNYREDPPPTWKVVLADNRLALDWLKARDDVENGKIGAVGGSLGGYVSSMMGVHESEMDVQCVNNDFGPTDFTDPSWDWDSELGQYFVAKFFGGVTYKQNPKLYENLSPAMHVSSDDASNWLFTRSTNDHLVPRSQMTRMIDALTKVGIKTEFYEYDGTGAGHANNLPPLQNLRLFNKRIDFMVSCLNSL